MITHEGESHDMITRDTKSHDITSHDFTHEITYDITHCDTYVTPIVTPIDTQIKIHITKNTTKNFSPHKKHMIHAKHTSRSEKNRIKIRDKINHKRIIQKNISRNFLRPIHENLDRSLIHDSTASDQQDINVNNKIGFKCLKCQTPDLNCIKCHRNDLKDLKTDHGCVMDLTNLNSNLKLSINQGYVMHDKDLANLSNLEVQNLSSKFVNE